MSVVSMRSFEYSIGSQPGGKLPKVMGPFDLGNGLFFYISVLTTTYFIEHSASEMTYIVSGGALNSTHSLTFIEHKLARENTGPAVALVDDNGRIKTSDYSLLFSSF